MQALAFGARDLVLNMLKELAVKTSANIFSNGPKISP